MTSKLRSRGYGAPGDELVESTSFSDSNITQIHKLMREGKQLDAALLMAKVSGAKKAEQKLSLLIKLREVEEGNLPYELDSYASIVRNELKAFMKEKYSKDQLRKIMLY